MESILKKEITVVTSMCDNKGALSVPNVFYLFTDIATEHAANLSIGAHNLAQYGVFWVATKIKMELYERPVMLDKITAATWPEAPGKIRCNRYYIISKGDTPVICAKSEWVAIDKDGRPHKTEEYYAKGIEHLTDTVCDGAFAKISDDFSGCEKLGDYKIKSTDIDIAQHMNNSAYIRALFGMYSCEELEKISIKGVEVAFKNQSFEGDTLSIYKRAAENSTEYLLVRSDGVVAVTVVISH